MVQGVAKATRQGEYDIRIVTSVSYVNRADDTVPEVTHLLNTAMNTCLTLTCHLSYSVFMVYHTVSAMMG